MRSGRIAITRSSAHSFCVSTTGTPSRRTRSCARSICSEPSCSTGAVAAAAPPLDGAQSRQQLARVVGLDQVVVGAGIEAADAVADLVARRQHDHHGPFAQRADRRHQRQAVAVLQVQVEQHGGVLRQ